MQTKVTVVSQTPGGKELGYRPVDGTNLYEIVFADGGVIPKALQGKWTRIKQIEAAINAWVQSDAAQKRSKVNARETAAKKAKAEEAS